MALVELSGRIHRSLEQIRTASILDLKNCLKEIKDALLEADFPESHVNEMERKIKEVINLPYASNRYKSIYQIIFRELCSMLDPGKSALIQEKRKPSIVMFIGLRGVEKTNTCGKYARYHLKKGFKPALVCADTFRTDASLRLKKAVKDKIPVYGSYMQEDPAEVAAQGIEKFTKERRDLVIIYTNDRHEQYPPLFEEMRQLSETMKPDLVVFVMDCSIGKAASFDQAQAFRQSFAVGVVIVTNVNSDSKAGGTLCAVAAAKCPMILAEIRHKSSSTKFEAFEVERFVMRLLWGDKRHEYTLRDMYKSYQNKISFSNQVSSLGPQGQLNLEKMRQHITIMDSMTDEELDRTELKKMSENRVKEIAKESKVKVREVVEMIKTYKRTAKVWIEMEEKTTMIDTNNLTDPMKMFSLYQVMSTTKQIKPVAVMPFDPLSTAVRSKKNDCR